MDGIPDRRRLSLADEPADKRLTALREVYGPSLNMDISPLTPDPVFEIDTLTLPGVFVTQSRNSPHRMIKADVSKENDDLLLAWSRNGGRGRMTCPGRVLRNGEPLLSNCADPFDAEMHSEFHVVNIRIRRAMIEPFLPNPERRFSRPISPDDPKLRLLDRYLVFLRREDPSVDAACGAAIAAHICDLVALSVGTTRDVEALAAMRGVRAARLAAVKRWVLARLDEPRLSVADAAAAEQVSTRYIQMLFEEEGTTFSAFLMNARLARAHRQLSNPLWGGTPISTIAFDSGFGDLSYFNRSFRAAYHERPTDVRHRAVLDRG
jgi:AraC-like DNA-binding protein